MNKHLTKEQVELFGIPSKFSNLVENVDYRDLGDHNPGDELYLLPAVHNFRDKWINACIEEDPKIAETPESLRNLQQKASPIDKYDSGIVYHVTVNDTGKKGLPVFSTVGGFGWGILDSRAGANPRIYSVGKYAELDTRYFDKYNLRNEEGKRMLEMI